jgi:hypothetical protein
MIQHNNTAIKLSVAFYLFIIMLNVGMLIVVMLSLVVPNHISDNYDFRKTLSLS